MKKLLLLVMAFGMFAVITPAVFATDVCSDTPESSADFYVETSRASWLMGQSCTDSNVVTTMPQGSVMHVIGMTEYWHKLVTEEGQVGWMWVDFVQPTSKTFNPVSAEPEPVVISDPVVEEPVVYSPMYDIAGYKYETAVWYVYNQGIVQGYPDGAYQPDRVINRAELLKIIIEAAYDDEFASYGNQSCFSDVPAGQWYTPYICFAKHAGIVQGYGDGSFQPAAEINFVEALKMALVGFGHEYTEGDPWYKDIVQLGGNERAIPMDIKSFSVAFTRGQMAEMITKIMKGQDGTLEEYVNNLVYYNYNVNYGTIDAGIDMEDAYKNGQCLWDLTVYDTGEFNDAGMECKNGDWLFID
ncbi:S-layer homology domain-containing protein [Patescibacteria group bacterium]|nr:S-layer homology domain-containing protein [Patescibacteria group bacterium]